MSDVMERLRGLADLFEAGDAPRHVVLHMRAGADEIERLRGRLEIDPSHPYDGIYARDETIRGLEKQIERLRAGGCARDQGTTQYCVEAAKLATENERLRAALEAWNGAVLVNVVMEGPRFAGTHWKRAEAAWEITRAALEEASDD